MAHLNLYLLGTPRIEREARQVEIDTRKATALIAYLALTGERHSRDHLTALLWPDYNSESARAALRRTLSALNHALKLDCLEITREQVGLLSELDLWVDVIEFRSLLSEYATHCHPHGDVCKVCLPLLEQAAVLYREDFLSGFTLRDSSNFDDWQFFETEALRREQAGVLEKLARGYSAVGEFEKAITESRRWLAIDPLREEAHRQLMECYAWAGQRNAALRQYRECVRILDHELGVAPLRETTALYQAISENRALPAPELAPPFVSPPGPKAATLTLARRAQAASEAEQALTSESRPERTPPQHQLSIHGSPLVGREAEWEKLVHIYSQEAKRGAVVVLTGEPGIGKTRLAEELLEYARNQGAVVMAARCFEGETNLAYAPFISALTAIASNPDAAQRLKAIPEYWIQEAAHLAPTLLTHLAAGQLTQPSLLPQEAPGSQARFFEALRQVIMHLLDGEKPGVLFLDDLNWADAASLDLLIYLVRRLGDTSVMILVTWQREALNPGGLLDQILYESQRAGFGECLDLKRFGAQEVASLVALLSKDRESLPADFTAQLHQETEGLPFFVVEYMKDFLRDAREGKARDWTMPAGVRGLLRSRLAATGEAAAQLLSAAAVIGRSFDFDTLREASGRSDVETVTGLDDLLAQGLIAEQASTSSGELAYDFVYENLRTLVLDETSLTRRRLLHRRAAEALARKLHGAREAGSLAGQIADHFLKSDQDERAAEYFRMAGEYARSVYANREALAHFQSSLAAGYPHPAELHEAIGDLHVLLGEYRRALSSYEIAAAVCDICSLANLEQKLGAVYLRRGNWELATSHFRAAIEALQVEDNPGWEARLHADWSLAAHQSGQSDQALALANRAVELAESAGDETALAQAHNLLGILARRQDDLPGAIEHVVKSLEIANRLPDPGARIAALNNLALAYADAGDLDKAIESSQEALQLCERLGDRHRAAALLNNLADLYHLQGDANRAMDYLKKAVVIFAEIGVEAGSHQSEIWKLTEW